jgi:outer membrane protein OmpA-like peptidoglycan-associated protein
MISTSRAAILLTVVAAGASCGPKKVPPAEPEGSALIVLLPDSESGTTGRASVSSKAGAVDLDAARESTSVVRGSGPSKVTVLSEGEVQRLFGAALEALPPAPIHFTLFYKFDSDELTDESSALVPQILHAVKERPMADVTITGHTDTIGTATSNAALGMKRATAVRTLLVDAGLNPASLEVASHGEADLLIPTADNVAEPRNRRVEITVR